MEVNDTEDPRTTTGDASYYLRKIYYGRVYEIVISGSSDTFTTDVRADLLVAPNLVTFQKRHTNISTQVFARGLMPKMDALFARTPQEIRDSYVEDKQYNAGKPVPVLAEYRRIPGAKLDGYENIAWKKPAPSVAQLKVRMVRVAGDRSGWTDTGLVLQPGDTLVGSAEGQVIIGSWSGATGPDTTGNGRLEMNIDGDVGPTGRSWIRAKATGSVKLRVYDSKYTDNTGDYTAALLVVPAAAIRQGECAQVDQSGSSACN